MPVNAIEDLPAAIGAEIRQHNDPCIRQIINLPPQEYPIWRAYWRIALPFGWRKTPRSVLAFGDQQITIVAGDPTGGLTTTVIPLADLVDIQVMTVLLYAWVEFHWVRNGQIAALRLEYNSVGENLIRRSLDQARRQVTVPCRQRSRDPLYEADTFPLKFRNFLHFSLLPGEHVEAAVYQPLLRRSSGRFRPVIAPNRAVALTDQNLLIIEEDPHGTLHRYTVITRFYPLCRVTEVTFVQADDGLIWLQFQAGANGASYRTEIPLGAPNAERLRKYWEQTG
jgi:hypothetical protein